MLWNVSDEPIAIKDRSIVVNISRNDTDFCIASQRRLEGIRLVVGKNIKIPNRPTSRLIAVKRTRQINFSSVLVNNESTVVSKLSRQTVANV